MAISKANAPSHLSRVNALPEKEAGCHRAHCGTAEEKVMTVIFILPSIKDFQERLPQGSASSSDPTSR